MKPGLAVATLVAPAGEVLAPAQAETFIRRVIQNGGAIDKTVWIDRRAADVFFTGAADVARNDLSFDILIQPAATRRKKFLIADMESTIIEQEMLDELAGLLGVGEKVADITRRAMNGELDFAEALAARVALLKNRPESLLHEAAARMTPMPGARDLVAAMKRAGGKAWLVSGGFTFFIRIIAEQIGFDRFFGNELKLEDGMIAGEVALPILGKEAKKELAQAACAEYAINPADILAVGDGANDIPMLQFCAEGGGLGVAYRARPRVRDVIHNQINRTDLSALIYAMGFG